MQNRKFSNIEKILLRAATDEDFRDKLYKDKKSVIENPEFVLTDPDKIFFKSIPQKKLDGMIENFITQRSSRRNFLKGAAASAALVISASMVPLSLVLAGGDNTGREITMGIRPDGSIPGGDPMLDVNSPVATATPDVYNPLTVETVGPEGKKIFYNYKGLNIIIPREAVDKSIEITIQLIEPSGINYKNKFLYLWLVQLTPLDIKFKTEIYICFRSLEQKRLNGYRLNERSYKKISGEIKSDENLLELLSDELEAIPDKSFWDPAEVSASGGGSAEIVTKRLGIYTVGYFI